MACEGILIGDDPAGAPEVAFEMLWEEFDRWYAGFGPRQIDWDAVYTLYRPEVTQATTPDELWDVLTTMLASLGDIHVELQDPARRRFFNAGSPSGTPGPITFDVDLIKRRYLGNSFQVFGGGRLLVGTLVEGIGYLHVSRLDGDGRGPSPWTEDIDRVIPLLAGLRGLILDLRGNNGGLDMNAHRIAGAFADQSRFVYTLQTRNGPGHGDFDEPTRYSIDPLGPNQFTGPIALITDRGTKSAAEVMSMLLVTLPHVTHAGVTTAGGFSSYSFDRFLPNGWVYRLSHQLVTAADGRSPEGVGIVPSIQVENSEADIAAGTDRMLEAALGQFNPSR